MSKPAPANKVPRTAAGTRTAAQRRTRYAATTIVLLAASTIISLFVIVLADRAPKRLDLTITRQHSLSPRTLAILERVDAPIEMIVSADLDSLPAASLEAMVDLLSAFEDRSSQLSFHAISTRSPDAPRLLGEAVQRFAQSHESAIARHREATAYAVQQTQNLDESFDRLAQQLASLASRLEGRAQAATALREAASQSELYADEFRRIKASLAGAASSTILGIDLPQADTLRSTIGPSLAVGGAWASDVVQAMRSIEQRVAQVGDLPDLSNLPDEIRVRADSVSTTAAAIFDRLDRLQPLEPLMIVRLLSTQQAVVLLSQRGASAIDFNTLFAASQAATQETSDRAAQQELRFNGEEALANAIAAVSDRAAPIIVLVHGENERLLDASGRPSTAGRRLTHWGQRLALRRIDVVEWPVALMENRPNLTNLMAQEQRPVVYVVLEAPSRLNLDTSAPTRAMAERASRIGRLAETITMLLDEGANLLISLEPSEMPAVGEEDPIAAALHPLGITPRVGNAIITRVSHPTQVVVDLYQRLRATVPGHPIAEALQGILTVFHFAMPIEIAASLPEGVRVWPIYRVEDPGETVWAESSWRTLRYANRAQPFARIPGGPNPPAPGSRNDLDDGPWDIAVAIERTRSRSAADLVGAGSRNNQRVIVVAAPAWFDDATTAVRQQVSGRAIAAFPGNTELFDASLFWLAHRDELIAPGIRRAEIARIAPLTMDQLAAIRWGLIVGLPVLILLLGVVYRLVRG